MRVRIHFEPVTLGTSIYYPYYLQTALYSLLDGELGTWMHDKGLVLEKRRLKPICFSRLMGEYKLDRERGIIYFPKGAALVVTSPISEICQSLLTGLLKRGEIILGKSSFPVSKVEIADPKVSGSSILVRTLSPITVYSTMLKFDGSKYTCYFSPKDSEFVSLCRDNLVRKARALGWEENQDFELNIEFKGDPKTNMVKFKNNFIKGYSGYLMISGPTRYLKLALDWGLGAKNSAGFGCLEITGGGNHQDRI
ncbi:CRISPR-associated endoribonuclease Cas6 [Thermosediminibacter oceani]|uniref:CRISPR-associated endoribonuclease n=1 Tax=Thermosediminibacter oceani (strain ATCC BAA-1034 / DSM 16646 / JW/IW-1228P) TaxID=555079 RepID=D9RZG4_THEOJ|nr:CRISPR-associated endoribonuclease Cas6 [Thermosediminibacter oceani]ADL06862.1 CRISPR-associated protein Cas6 [Thermosediminibacter oceani DSM 16646]